MKNERTIKALTKADNKVYIYLSNSEIGNKFMEQAELEGFTFADGVKPTDPDRGYEIIMALNPNNTLSYVGTNGRIAFSGGFKSVSGKTLVRIDYEKYIAGNEDYMYRVKDNV